MGIGVSASDGEVVNVAGSVVGTRIDSTAPAEAGSTGRASTGWASGRVPDGVAVAGVVEVGGGRVNVGGRTVDAEYNHQPAYDDEWVDE